MINSLIYVCVYSLFAVKKLIEKKKDSNNGDKSSHFSRSNDYVQMLWINLKRKRHVHDINFNVTLRVKMSFRQQQQQKKEKREKKKFKNRIFFFFQFFIRSRIVTKINEAILLCLFKAASLEELSHNERFIAIFLC